MEVSERQNTVFDVFTEARRHNALHQYVDDTPLDGKHIQLHGRELLSFASCSYLGLETDERLKEGCRRAVDRYGTQFSASRAYISAPPYRDFEERLEKIFGGYVLTTGTTTLGHLSAIPVLCQEKDFILLDQMVHNSVQMATTLARANGTGVKLVRHGDWRALEEQIDLLVPNYRHVWLMIDGVYSMFGDMPDVSELTRLLTKYPTLHLYVDDAHGMSIAGKNGQGMHLSRMGWHPRMVLAMSFAKAFGTGGGCLVFPDAELRDRVRLCGAPYTFGGPVQPPIVGASVACADIHLTPEITVMQDQLRSRVQFLNAELQRRNVPLYDQNHTPIFFVKCGPLKVMHSVLRRMQEEGFFVAAGIYPGVPLRHNGARISITRHHSEADLTALAQAMEHHYPKALDEVGMSRADVESLFAYKEKIAERQRKARLAKTFELADGSMSLGRPATVTQTASSVSAEKLTLQYETTVGAFAAAEWDSMLGHRGTMNHATLKGLEAIFRNQAKPENNWGWHYLVVRHETKAIAATFFIDALWKDDMMMRAEVSQRIETLRVNDPYLLTSRMLVMGSGLTEGNHLYLDRSGPWAHALELILDEAAKIQAAVGASGLIIRDLPEGDTEFDALMTTQGLVKMPTLTSYSLDVTTWSNDKEFLERLTDTRRRTRRRLRVEMLDVQKHFTTKYYRKGVDAAPTAEEFKHFYSLYKKVKVRKRRINTFDLPETIFEQLWATPGWELMTLHLAPEAQGPANGEAVVVVASCLNAKTFVAVVAGLDSVEREISPYRQMLWRIIGRAKELGATSVELGMDADREKVRLGAVGRSQCVYLQLTDHFSAEIIEQLVQGVSLGEDADAPAKPEADDAD